MFPSRSMALTPCPAGDPFERVGLMPGVRIEYRVLPGIDWLVVTIVDWVWRWAVLVLVGCLRDVEDSAIRYPHEENRCSPFNLIFISEDRFACFGQSAIHRVAVRDCSIEFTRESDRSAIGYFELHCDDGGDLSADEAACHTRERIACGIASSSQAFKTASRSVISSARIVPSSLPVTRRLRPVASSNASTPSLAFGSYPP